MAKKFAKNRKIISKKGKTNKIASLRQRKHSAKARSRAVFSVPKVPLSAEEVLKRLIQKASGRNFITEVSVSTYTCLLDFLLLRPISVSAKLEFSSAAGSKLYSLK